MNLRYLLSTALLLVAAVPALAQQAVKLEFTDGRVTLSAQNASVRTILAEWARLGGATIVNADRVAGPPVTLELSGVPERQALDTLLREVAGYVAAPRQFGKTGASAFDRIMILPTSTVRRTAAPVPAAAAATVNRPSPVIIPTERPLPEEPEDVFDSPAVRLSPTPVVIQQTPPGQNIPAVEGPNGAQPQQTPATGPTVINPFGTTVNPFGTVTGSSPRPGTIAPFPQPQPQPGNRPQEQ